MCYTGNESTCTLCCLKLGLYSHLSKATFTVLYSLSICLHSSFREWWTSVFLPLPLLFFIWKCVNRLLMPQNVVQESKWDSLPKPKKPLKYLGFIQWKFSLIQSFHILNFSRSPGCIYCHLVPYCHMPQCPNWFFKKNPL